jgi:hypothetical protein
VPARVTRVWVSRAMLYEPPRCRGAEPNTMACALAGGVVGHDDTPMIPEPMPQFVQPLLNKLKDVFPQPPNHVLVSNPQPQRNSPHNV